VFLLTVEVLHGEPVDRKLLVSREPLLDRRERNGEQFGIEPRRRLRGFGEEDLHLLALRVDVVVTLVLVVLERREVPHLVRQLPYRIAQLECSQQSIAATRQRALQARELANPAVELRVCRVPG
jgi:hypothetical protein